MIILFQMRTQDLSDRIYMINRIGLNCFHILFILLILSMPVFGLRSFLNNLVSYSFVLVEA